MAKTTAHDGEKAKSPHWIEWAMGILCSLLVAGLFVMLVLNIVRHREEPARFEVAVVAIEPAGAHYRVTIAVRNPSMATGAQVHVRGDLQDGAETVESADVTFDYVASESVENGALFFATEPTAARLRLSVIGYTDP